MGAKAKFVRPSAGLGEAIYSVRVARKMSAKALGAAVGMSSHVEVIRWENGQKEPSILMLLRIASLAAGVVRKNLIEECRLRLANRGWLEEMRPAFREVAR